MLTYSVILRKVINAYHIVCYNWYKKYLGARILDEAYIPAIITASVALIAAIGAQILNNWLTYKRENKRLFKTLL